MKIGITERGDAGINPEWGRKLNTVDGVILITKNMTQDFCLSLVEMCKSGFPFIVHCTCTGYGGTVLEPNVPSYKEQLDTLKWIIDIGIPANQFVLRIDPIFPSEKGLEKVREVLDYFTTLNTGVTRIRISLVDEYQHVKERYRERGWTPLYGDNFGPSYNQKKMVAALLNKYPYKFELCAEDDFAKMLNNGIIQGCISENDLSIMHLPMEEMGENPQNRRGCHCLSCKTELLTDRKPCPNGCVYCFWRK